MSDELLQTKLFIPPLRPDFVARPRLIEQLNRGLHLGCKFTLISAPAGFGKTTLVLEWINHIANGEMQEREGHHPQSFTPHPSKVAWVSLDKADNDPARFFTYLVTALLKIGVDVSQPVQKLLQAPQLPVVETVITRLINDIAAAPFPFLLMLDDYHAITETVVHQGIEFLLEQQPPPIHLVIVTRQDPSLALPRLRGRGQVTELRQRDLRFTSEEAAAFLRSAIGLNLTASEIAALEERTEGWIVGLQLAAVSMRRLEHRADVSSFVHAFTGSNRHVLDYLVEEVLQQQTGDVQEFLLQTAILDRLCGSLCAAVTGQEESQALLEQMERENLFVIPLDDERRWYRYHHLFAELLQARQTEAKPEQISELHRRAAIWHEQNGLGADAIRHALATQDMTLAAGIIDKAVRSLSTWSSANIAAILAWINALPDVVTRTKPWLRLFASRAYYVTGQWEVARRILNELEEALRKSPEKDDTGKILETVLADWASYAVVRGDVREAMRYAKQVLARVPEGQSAARIRPLSILGMAHFRSGNMPQAGRAYSEAIDIARVIGGPAHLAAAPLICNLAETQLLQGQLRLAAATCEEALRLGTVDGEPIPAAGFAWLVLGKIRYEQNDLEIAEQLLLKAMDRLSSGGITDQFGNLQAVLAQVRQAQGQWQSASSVVHQAVQSMQSGNIPRLSIQAQAYQARIWLAQGDLASATRWGEEYRQVGETEYSREFEDLTLARLLLAQEQETAALALLAGLLTSAEAASRLGRVIEILALRSLALQATGETDQAVDELTRALNLAQPEGYVRVFVNEGKAMAHLLRLVAQSGERLGYINSLMQAFESERPDSDAIGASPAAEESSALKPSILVEPLTEREMDVLRHLAQGLSNREIAARLFVSPNTVRTHTYNLYGKLGVHGRMQAVARARELELLPPS